MARRSSNEAGLAGLSAFWVANRSSNRTGLDESRHSRKAEQAILRWASVGGLKEESRTYRREGTGDDDGVVDGGIEAQRSKVLDAVMK